MGKQGKEQMYLTNNGIFFAKRTVKVDINFALKGILVEFFSTKNF